MDKERRRPNWPKSASQLRELGYESVKRHGRASTRQCDCGAKIYFAWTPSSAKMPLVEVERPEGLPAGERYFQPHFIDCPFRGEWRKPRRKAARRGGLFG